MGLSILLAREAACGSINKDTELFHHTSNQTQQHRVLAQLSGWLVLSFVCL